MLIRRYLLFLLLIPLLCSILFVLVYYFASSHFSYSIAGRIVYPYAFFWMLTLLWSHKKTPGAIRRAVYRMPLEFLLIEAIYLAGESYLKIPHALAPAGLMAILIMIAVFVIIIGYLCIFLAEIGYFALIEQYQRDHANRVNPHMTMRC